MKKKKDKMKKLRDFNMVGLINRSGSGVHDKRKSRSQEKLNLHNKIKRGDLDNI